MKDALKQVTIATKANSKIVKYPKFISSVISSLQKSNKSKPISQIEKFNTGGLVGDNFADIFGSPFRPNERNRFESSGAYGNPLKSGSLAIQTGEGGFLAPGVFGGGAIKGRDDLIAFAGQGFTSGLNDRRRFGSTKPGLRLRVFELARMTRRRCELTQRNNPPMRKPLDSQLSGAYSKRNKMGRKK